MDLDLDLNALGLPDMIRLQDRVAETLRRRFGRFVALCFTDTVGSTAHFTAFGEAAGRALQQRHIDLLDHVAPRFGGRVVDTAGDGGFLVFERVEQSALAMIELQNLISGQNSTRSRTEQLVVRSGLHWGEVLTDGVAVKGNEVNLCSRVAHSGLGGEIRLTRSAFGELSSNLRARCRLLYGLDFKGIPETVEVMALDWRDRTIFPASVRIDTTGELIALPDQDAISFGRLGESNGADANDVVLLHPDPALARQVSRWHFELRRYPDGYVLRNVSQGLTEVDGTAVPKGSEVRIAVGSVVCVARVLTLTFLATPPRAEVADMETHLGTTTLSGKLASLPPGAGDTSRH
jgi:class 3 adenylate cyclase